MAALYNWLQQTWSSLVEVADLSDTSTPTDEPGFTDPCHLFQDALDEELRLMDLQNERIGNLLDQFWNCRKQSGAGLSTDEFQRQNVTQQNVNSAKLLLTTTANQVRQVVEEIEIVTQRDTAE